MPNSSAGPGVISLVLSGSLDQYHAEELKQQLVSAADLPGLRLDFTSVEHLDAAALQVLLACKAGLKQEKLPILGADPSIQLWIRMAGAEEFFDFLETNG